MIRSKSGGISPVKSPVSILGGVTDRPTSNIGSTSTIMGSPGVLGTMHEGGMVDKTGAYELEKGEKVVPKDEAKKTGRNSEYRKVFLSRKAKK